MESLRFKKGEVLFGRYKLDERLGEGGMGQVWAATDIKLERRVALKIIQLKYADHPAYRARFEREAKAVARLKHPNIVQLYTAEFTLDGWACMVMELIEGKDLRTYIEEVRRVDLVSAVYIAIQVADALGLAHQAGVWHRDIKPENIMLSDEGHASLLDFGICIQRSDPEERPVIQGGRRHGTGRLGTVAYTPPEEAQHQTADQRGDFYQLGLVVYEMLAGRKPYPGVNEASATDMLAAHAYAEPQPLVEVVPGCPPWIWRIVARLLEKDPDARYDDVNELIRDLHAGLETVPKEHAMARAIDQHKHEQARKKVFADKRASLASMPAVNDGGPVDAPRALKGGGTEPMMPANVTQPLTPNCVPSSPYSPRRADPVPAPAPPAVAVTVTGPLPAEPSSAPAPTPTPTAPAWSPPYLLSPPAVPPLLSSFPAPAARQGSAPTPGPVAPPSSPARRDAPAMAPPTQEAALPAAPPSSSLLPHALPSVPQAADTVVTVSPPKLGPALLPAAPPQRAMAEMPSVRGLLGSLVVGGALAAVVVVVFWPRMRAPLVREDSAPVAPSSVVPVASATAPVASVAPVTTGAPPDKSGSAPIPPVEVAVTAAPAATSAAPAKAARPPSQPVKRSPPKPTVNIGGKEVPVEEVRLFGDTPVRKDPIGGKPEY